MAKKKSNRYQRTPGVIAPTKTLQEKLEPLALEELSQITNVDECFKRLILKFTHYLRGEGFSISVDALLKFFQLYSSFDVFQLEEIRLTLKSLMAKDKEQFDQFNEQFDRFFQGTVQQAHNHALNQEKDKMVASKTAHLKAQQELKEQELEEASAQLALQEERAQAYLKTLRERQELESESLKQRELDQLTALSEKAASQARKGIMPYGMWKQSFPSDHEKVKTILSNPKISSISPVLESLLAQESKTVVQFLKEQEDGFAQLSAGINELLMKAISSDVNDAFKTICIQGAKTLAKIKELVEKSNRNLNEELSKIQSSHHEEASKANQSVLKLKNQTNQLKNQVQTLSNQINNAEKLIEKEISQQHRLEFLEGKNSVQTTLTNMDLLNQDVEKMSDTQYEQLTEIIKANATKFRTKISRSMIRFRSKRFNYHRTMKNSLKTFGVPMELFFEKPKIKKTKIICILDVSGSCVKSSKLLLRFIYELSSVFKGGVKSYVFVKHLADVSQYFTDYHLNDAIEKSLTAVPRTYSDYHHALRQFHEEFLGEVDRNTIVIFLGDARNNKNNPGLNYLQDIQSQAKSVLWLNTEEKEKWNTHDSIIGLYQEHLDQVFEILTTQDLIKFLEGFKLS